MNINPKDLLMINATIIGGFLILLTISSFSPAEFPNRSIFVTIAVVIVIIFSIACLNYLNDNDNRGILFSKIGFYINNFLYDIYRISKCDQYFRSNDLVRNTWSRKNSNE